MAKITKYYPYSPELSLDPNYIEVTTKSGVTMFVKRKRRDEAFLKRFSNLIEKARKASDYIVFTDGSADNMKKGKPMHSAFVIYKGEEEFYHESLTFDSEQKSNNVAEVVAIKSALSYLLGMGFKDCKLAFFSDSSFCVDYLMNLKWKNINYGKPYANEAVKARDILAQFSKISFNWIPRELNQRADELAN